MCGYLKITGYDELPDTDVIMELHGRFEKHIVSVFNDATIRRVEFKVLSQISSLHT